MSLERHQKWYKLQNGKASERMFLNMQFCGLYMGIMRSCPKVRLGVFSERVKFLKRSKSREHSQFRCRRNIQHGRGRKHTISCSTPERFSHWSAAADGYNRQHPGNEGRFARVTIRSAGSAI